MRRLAVATSNSGKLREFEEALAAEHIEVVGLDIPVPIEESGSTFDENAKLKAEAYSTHTDLTVLADDSGLEVDALGGAPGVESARWGGAGLDDAGRCARLISLLGPTTERSARFRCVLALARAGKTIATFSGEVSGTITTEPRGQGGFGYDPVFYHPESGRTFAELTISEKRRISHRGRAIAALLAALRAGDPRLTGPRAGW